jgi:hypothetical protein
MHATVGPTYVQDLATSIPVYAAIGPEEFSIRAWPTLHKDVALMEALGGPATQLVDARATIADTRSAERTSCRRGPGPETAAVASSRIVYSI